MRAHAEIEIEGMNGRVGNGTELNLSGKNYATDACPSVLAKKN